MFNIDFDISILENLVYVVAIFAIVKGISAYKKNKKRNKNLKDYKEMHYNQDSVVKRDVKKSEDKKNDEDDPWASFDEKWKDLD